jgi:hypothetical protein
MLKLSQLHDTLSEGDEELNEKNDDYEKYYISTPFFLKEPQYGNWEKLKESLKKGYNPNGHPRGFVTVVKIWFTDEYLVYDGSHRVKTLREMYGGEHQIEVKVIPKITAVGQLILLILLLPLVLIKRKINGV